MTPNPSFDDAVRPDNVVQHRAETVPADKFHALLGTLEEQSEEAAALRKALTREVRTSRALQREIDDLLEQAADGDVVRTALVYWREKTGRDAKTRIPLSGARARDVRWVIRTFGISDDGGRAGARVFCLAVVGLTRSEWWVRNAKTDTKHLCRDRDGKFDESRVEMFRDKGLAVLGVAK